MSRAIANRAWIERLCGRINSDWSLFDTFARTSKWMLVTPIQGGAIEWQQPPEVNRCRHCCCCCGNFLCGRNCFSCGRMPPTNKCRACLSDHVESHQQDLGFVFVILADCDDIALDGGILFVSGQLFCPQVVSTVASSIQSHHYLVTIRHNYRSIQTVFVILVVVATSGWQKDDANVRN